MPIESTAGGASSAVGRWSRFLGVSLRPWAGQAPVSLLLRGAIHVAISGFFLVLAVRVPGEDRLTATADELSLLRGWMVLAIIALVVLIGIGLARMVVGALDLVPRRRVAGTVVSLRDRQVGDFLPLLIQRQIFERRNNGLDGRKTRTEVVLHTEQGLLQWTVRSARTRRELREGSQVTLTVTPLAGHVARVEPLGQ